MRKSIAAEHLAVGRAQGVLDAHDVVGEVVAIVAVDQAAGAGATPDPQRVQARGGVQPRSARPAGHWSRVERDRVGQQALQAAAFTTERSAVKVRLLG